MSNTTTKTIVKTILAAVMSTTAMALYASGVKDESYSKGLVDGANCILSKIHVTEMVKKEESKNKEE